MSNTDALLARLSGEAEERTKFMDGLMEAAEKESRDLNGQEMELLTRTRERLNELTAQIEPLRDAARIAGESRGRTAEISRQFASARGERAPQAYEYRSAGAYVLDYWKAGLGADDAKERLDLFQRAAAHQTTGDNPGLLPQQMLGPVITFVDQSRPLVGAFGPKPLPSGSWSRPKISQHTDVAKQAGEKTELVSRKMVIGMVPVTADTYGGYVNVSRQNIDWSQPAIMDLVINDLAAVYAQETEEAFCAALDGATTPGATLPASPTAADITAAIWSAVGVSYAAMKGVGQTIIAVSPDMLGLVGPLFPPVNPSNAQSTGLNAGSFATGAQGSISGLGVVCSAGLDAGTMIVANTAAAEVYEDRIGALQVVEPSVLGVQVAYAGYFAPLIIEPAGLIEITKTP